MTRLAETDLFRGEGARVQPGLNGYVLIPDETRENIKVVEMRWGLRPRQGEKPWHNVRAEGKWFPADQRCLVTCDGYFINVKEGPNRGRWHVTWPGEPQFCMAGIWRPALPDWPASYAIITCEPGPDLSPYEDRQSVFLPPDTWGEWLSGRAKEEDVLKPAPPGSLAVSRVGRTPSIKRREVPIPDALEFTF
jgi:putative SOS response-associated peptidase YedK